MGTISIYTDGSSHPKTREGGWAFCVAGAKKNGAPLHTANGYAGDTTNNRMELTAVINAIEYAYSNHADARTIKVTTDSKYVSETIYFEWYKGWRDKGWTNPTSGEPTKNADLWEEMYQLLNRCKFRKIDIQVMWVRGHNGNHYNEICDKLAKAGRYNQKINPTYGEV